VNYIHELQNEYYFICCKYYGMELTFRHMVLTIYYQYYNEAYNDYL